MRDIALEPAKVWDYYQRNAGKLQSSMHEIASNDEFGVKIYITASSYGDAQVIVEMDDDREEITTVCSAEECERVCKSVYADYLTSAVVSSAVQAEDEEIDRANEEEFLIEAREQELDNAAYNFLMDVLDEYQDEMDELVETAKEHFLEFMAREMKLPVYRPMHLVDEDGEEFFSEYPYEDMIYDDEVKVGFE